jgi:Flp pilus assembly protein TadG
MRGDVEARGGLRASASRRCQDERGAAAAEAMVVLPVLVAVGLGLVWVLSLAVAQVRVVDGAREGARVAARGEGGTAVRTAALRVAPAGATVGLRRGSGLVTVVVTAHVRGPGGLFAMLPSVEVTSKAAAAEEPG